jgi:predicted membrane chloride channel (bestrophin family)
VFISLSIPPIYVCLSQSLSKYLYLSIYIYIYICVCHLYYGRSVIVIISLFVSQLPFADTRECAYFESMRCNLQQIAKQVSGCSRILAAPIVVFELHAK